MENKKIIKEKAFTVIELVVVMAIFLFIIGAAVSIFLSIVREQKNVLSEQQVLNQISYLEEYMSKALRMAKTASSTAETNCLGSGNSGYIYLLTRYDANVSQPAYRGIKFLNQTDTSCSNSACCEEFFLDNTTDPSHPVLKKLEYDSSRTDVSPSDSQAVDLTSSGLQINSVKFSVDGSNGSAITCSGSSQCTQNGASDVDSVQPRVTILLNVAIAGDNNNGSCSDALVCKSGQTCVSGMCVLNRVIQTTISRRNLNEK